MSPKGPRFIQGVAKGMGSEVSFILVAYPQVQAPFSDVVPLKCGRCATQQSPSQDLCFTQVANRKFHVSK